MMDTIGNHYVVVLKIKKDYEEFVLVKNQEEKLTMIKAVQKVH